MIMQYMTWEKRINEFIVIVTIKQDSFLTLKHTIWKKDGATSNVNRKLPNKTIYNKHIIHIIRIEKRNKFKKQSIWPLQGYMKYHQFVKNMKKLLIIPIQLIHNNTERRIPRIFIKMTCLRRYNHYIIIYIL